MANSFNGSRRQISRNRAQRLSTRRRIFLEKLEDRHFLAADWHNPVMPSDVNADQLVSPLDALLVINEINFEGGRQLQSLAPGTKPKAYYDTNADGLLTPLDALIVINSLNSNGVAGSGSGTVVDQPRVGIVPVSDTIILATFDRPMGASAIDPANYKITGDDGQPIEVLGALFGEGESFVQLQTAKHSSAGVSVNIQNVSDYSGQAVFFEGRKLLTGNPKGAVVSVAATSPTRVVVVFNEAMADNALAPQNYSIKDPSGKSLLVTDVHFNGPLGMVFVLTTAAQSNVNYSLTVNNVTDLQNDGLASNTGSFAGIAGLPKLVAATQAGANSILLTYNQPMSDDALSPSSYIIKNASGGTLSVLDAQFIGTERRLVQLFTGPQSPGTYKIELITATDTNQNPVMLPGAAGFFQGAPAPSLISAIPTDTTHVFLTFGTALSDSGLSPSSYKLEKLDAQGNVASTLPIGAIEFVGSRRTVVSLTTPYQSDAQYRISTTTRLFDESGLPLDVASQQFQGLGSQPRVTNTVSSGPTTILITFDVSMSDDALKPASYVINNALGEPLQVTNVQFVGTDRRVVQLTTGPQVVGIYTIVSINATDLGGSKVAAPGAAGEFAGAPAPVLTKASPADPTHLVLTFTGPVSDSALAPSSYLLQKLDASGSVVGSLTISAAAFIGSQNTVVSLTTPYLADGRYRIATTSALTDQSGAPLEVVGIEFQGIGAQPKLIGATSTGPNTVLLITSAAMSDDVLAASSYVMKNSSGAALEVIGAQFIGTERRVIQLTTSPQSARAYTVLSIAANDLSGNPLASPGGTGVFQGAPETKLVRSIPTDPNHIVLTFGGPVGDSALTPSSYTIERLDTQGLVIGSLSVNSAAFVGDQRTVVSLTTPYQADARYRISTTSALTNAAGAPLALVQQEFQGFSSLAKLVAVTSTGPTTIQAIFNVPLSDDALSPASYVIKDSNGLGLQVVSARFVGTEQRVVELTTAQQAAGTYTIQSVTVTDINGSPVSVLGSIGGFEGSLATTLAYATPSDETHLVLTFGGPVGDSALAPSSYKIDKLDAQGYVIGSLSVSSATFVGDQHRVVSLTTPFQTSGQYRISTTVALRDTSGASLPVAQLHFQGLGSAAKLVGATSTGQTTMLLTFNVSMSDDVLGPASYVIHNSSGRRLPVVSAQFVGTERRVVKLTTGPQSAGAYTFQSITATDVRGNSLASTLTIGGVQGIPTPSLNIATAADSTHIYLTFAGPVGDSALAPSSYHIAQLDNLGNVVGNLTVSSATFVGDQRTVVVITTPSQTSTQYRLATTSSLTDVSGAPVPRVQQVFRGIGSTAKLIGATSTGSTTMLLTFNVAMSDDALSPSSYVISNSLGVNLPVVSAQFVGTERRVVQITTGPQASTNYTLQSITATDVSGNSVSSNIAIGGIPGTASPSLNIAIATDSTHIYLTFAGPVGDSALSPSSYKIQKLDASGNVIGNLAVTSAAFVGNQRTVVSLTTPSQSAGPYRLTTTNTLTNVAGATVPTVQINFQGVGSQAQLVAVSSTSSTTLIVTFNVPMSDDALSPSLYVIQDASNNRLQVTNAQFIGTQHRLVQLTTGPQTSTSYTVVSINATDVGGSTTIIPTSTTINTFPGPVTSGGSSVPVDGPPRVTGAASLSNTSVLVAFSEPMDDNALNTSNYFIVQDNLNPEVGYVPVLSAVFSPDDHRRAVILTTGSQNELTYSVTAVNVTDQAGNALAPAVLAGGQRIDPTTASFPGSPAGFRSVAIIANIVSTEDRDADEVIGPGDLITDNKGFKHVVRDRNGDGQLTLDGADGITDVNGDGMINGDEYDENDVLLVPGDTVVIPAGFGFDADGDGLTDNVEVRGWTVTVTLLNGNTVTREVTSDPYNPDTDGDDLWDAQELNIGIDPRSADTDGDQLGDYAEFNEIYSDPWSQDTDEDGLDDFLEFAFFKTSPYLADTDGDQLTDDYEIFGNRNPRISDLPRPEISVGEVNLQLDVRFTESNDQERRELETREVTATLSRSASQTFTRSDTVTVEAHMGLEVGTAKENGNSFIAFAVGGSVGYTFAQTAESASETKQEYSNSLSTDKEVTLGFSVERTVEGALMQVAVDLRNVSTLAYRVKNLQLTAFIQDPQDHSRLTPIATLLPDSEPEDGFTLGPLVAEKGPISFSNDSIIPSLVEALMANSSGLIFRISNYDIIDEDDRNFAFTSQEIIERTSRLVIDYGGASSLRAILSGEAFDELQPGDETEIYRVATSTGQVIDTNFDGTIDDADRQAIFDANGKEVGITIFEALSAVGLTHFEARLDPASGQYLEYDGSEFESVPSATDFGTNESVTFNVDPRLQRGTRVRVTESGGGLTAGKDYFLRNLGGGQYSFYKSVQSAASGKVADRVNLTASISATVFTFLNFANQEDLYLSSYSTYIEPRKEIGGITYPAREKIFRIRGISNDTINQKYWEILTPDGIDQVTKLSNLILKTDSPVSLNFVQDLDKDTLSADVEFFLRTTDSPMPAGAEVPGTTDSIANTVTFSTDPAFSTGTIVRVFQDTARAPVTNDPGLLAGTDYFVRNLGRGSYSFYGTFAQATGNVTTGLKPLPGKVATGIYPAAKPFSTNKEDMFVAFSVRPTSTDISGDSVNFSGANPQIPTGTAVQVTQSGGGLLAGTNYYLRDLGGETYKFYDSATNATNAKVGTENGLINLTSSIIAGVLRSNDRRFPTATLVQVTKDTGGVDPLTNEPRLKAGKNYYVRDLGSAKYSFYESAATATAGTDNTDGRIELTGLVTAGIFSPTPKGRDTDGDGLDDRFEALFGWTVSTPQRTYQVYSSPNRADSNFDKPKPGVDSDGDGVEDRLEYDGSDLHAAPAGWIDADTLDTDDDGLADQPDGLRGRFEIYQLVPQSDSGPDYVLDPSQKDTDADGINDSTEIIGFKITPITGEKPYLVVTNPTNPFTDSDTFSDGLERLLGLDPTNGADTDEDGDGLPDLVETLGWTVYTFERSTNPYVQGAYAQGYSSHVTPDISISGANVVKFKVSTAPTVGQSTPVKVTGGGLSASTNYFMGRRSDLEDPGLVPYSFYMSANDAAKGTVEGALTLTGVVTDIALHVRPSSTDVAANTVRFDIDRAPNIRRFALVQVSQSFAMTFQKATETTMASITNAVEWAAFGLQYAGQSFVISGAGSNNGTYTVASVSGKKLEIVGDFATASTAVKTLVPDKPYFLGRLAEQNDPNSVSFSLYVSATDAASGRAKGAVNLINPISEVFIAREARQQSHTDSVDSDEDGLSDYEEFFLGTNPINEDSDSDGIEDRLEHLGYSLEHKMVGSDLLIIKTDPLDADYDNDKRTDGEEAELDDIEQNAWVVRVRGKTPYRVYSNPLKADADFDGLVDGDEFNLNSFYPNHHTDPNNSDTDGDARDDGVEVAAGTNALAEDVRVTVVVEPIEIPYGAFNAYEFDLVVRPPGTDVAGLNSQTQPIVNVDSFQIGRVWVANRSQSNGVESRVFYVWRKVTNGVITSGKTDYEDWIRTDNTTNQQNERIYDPGAKGVPLGAEFKVGYQNAGLFESLATDWYTYTGNATAAIFYTLGLDGIAFRSGGTVPALPLGYSKIELLDDALASRKFTFGMAKDERFSIEGSIRFNRSGTLNPATDTVVKLGGLEGARAAQVESNGQPKSFRPVFSWMQVADKYIEDFYFDIMVDGVSIGKIKFYYIIG